MEPEKRTSISVALVFGLVATLLVSIEADTPAEKTRGDLYLRSAQAEARLHAASIATLGDEAEDALPADPFANAEDLMAGIQGVGEEARAELLYGMAVAAAAAGQPETARILASRSGAAPEALRPLRFAWQPNSAPPTGRSDLEAAIGGATLTPWSQDRLRILWYQRTGDHEGAEKLRSTQTAADRTWLHELGGLFVSLIFLGLVGLAILAMHRRLIDRWSEAHPDYLQARFRTTPWETLTLFLLWFIGSQAGGVALAHLLRPIPKGAIGLLVYLFSAALGLALVFIFGLQGFRRDAATNYDTSRLRDLLTKVNLGSKDLTRRAILWGLAGFAAALPLVWGLSLLSLVLVGGDTHPAIPIFISSDSTLDRVLLLGTICLLAPVFEEFMFRGYLLNRFNKMLGVYSGTALSALVFAAIHLSLGSFLPLMGLGVILAIVARHSGSLWASVVTHALWNLMNVLFLQLLYR